MKTGTTAALIDSYTNNNKNNNVNDIHNTALYETNRKIKTLAAKKVSNAWIYAARPINAAF